jgi:hypothetical protein
VTSDILQQTLQRETLAQTGQTATNWATGRLRDPMVKTDRTARKCQMEPTAKARVNLNLPGRKANTLSDLLTWNRMQETLLVKQSTVQALK